MRDDWDSLSARETNSPESRAENPVEGGVLAALPRTRPQRASPRREAARKRADTAKPRPARAKPKSTGKAQPAGKAQPTADPKPTPKPRKPRAPKKTAAKATKPKPRPRPRPRPAPARTPPAPKAPKQGYEPEEEVELGKTVNPPSGVELVESVADIFGELANSGLAAGGRILKDAFSLLRRP